MKKSILVLVLLFCNLFIYAQSSSEVLVLSAVIKDKVIANAQVIFQKNGQTSVPKFTNASGKVNIPEEYQDDPNLTVIIKKEGYSTLVSKCPCGGLTYAISPFMNELDGMRIVLNWGKSPLDIDSHLSYQGGYVCYYQKDASQANLDVDDTDSYGPETITITKKIDGKKYVYAVHDFSDRDLSNNSNLSNISKAKVFVYIGNTLIKTYAVPTQRKGNVWIPFTIDENGNLVDVGDFKNASSWEGVRAILRDYRFDNVANTVITTNDKNESVSINKKGEQAYHSGDIEGSINFYQQAIDLDPKNGQAYSNLGLAFQKLNREAEALWANRKAIDLAEGNNANIVKASSFYNIAKIYEKKGQWSEALQNYKSAKQNNNNPAYDKGIARVTPKIR
jgi:tetratricopeptide (TPR) repeat protein